MKFNVYALFSFVNTVLYCFPAHWVWSEEGWLFKEGFIDFAGNGPVHVVGGFTGYSPNPQTHWSSAPKNPRTFHHVSEL